MEIVDLLFKHKEGMHTKQIAKELKIQDYRIVGILCSELMNNGILEGDIKTITWEGKDYGARIYKLVKVKPQ